MLKGIRNVLIGVSLVGLGGAVLQARHTYQQLQIFQNNETLREYVQRFIEQPVIEGRHIYPDYERTAEDVLLHYELFNHLDHAAESARREFFKDKLREIIAQLPSYARLHIMTKKASRASLDEFLEHGHYRDNFKKIDIIEVDKLIGIWAQDLGEVVLNDGKPTLLVPFRNDYSPGQPTIAASDFLSLMKLREVGVSVEFVPLVFDGGNVWTDHHLGKDLVYVKQEDIAQTMSTYSDVFGISLTIQETFELFRKGFGADEVVVLGARTLLKDEETALHQQPWSLYHNDYVTIFHGNNQVSVNTLQDPQTMPWDHIDATLRRNQERYRDQLGDVFDIISRISLKYNGTDFILQTDPRILRLLYPLVYADTQDIQRQLTEQGYEVHQTPWDWEHFIKYQSYTNAARYVDRRTGKRVMLLPLFPTKEGFENRYRVATPSEKYPDEWHTKFDGLVETVVVTSDTEYADEGLNRNAVDHYKERGYDVQPIRDKVFLFDGNVNCATLVF